MKRVQYIINRAPNLGITLEKELKLLLAYDDEVKKYAKIFNICNFWATVKVSLYTYSPLLHVVIVQNITFFVFDSTGI